MIMKQDDKIKYQLNLWQLRSQLQDKGIRQVIPELLKEGLWKEDKQNHNYLLGRMQDDKFLEALNKLNEINK